MRIGERHNHEKTQVAGDIYDENLQQQQTHLRKGGDPRTRISEVRRSCRGNLARRHLPQGARFRVRNHDDAGDLIPCFARGRTGTVVTVECPVVLADDIHGRKADVEGIVAIGLADVLDLLGVVVEMVHIVQYDDEPGVDVRLSHMWMEPLPQSAPSLAGKGLCK